MVRSPDFGRGVPAAMLGALLAATTLLGGAASTAGAAAAPDLVEELLFDLQMVPLDGQAPAPFTLDTLDGKRLSLADFRGKVVLLYFWATW